jgi:hypothetical protein
MIVRIELPRATIAFLVAAPGEPVVALVGEGVGPGRRGDGNGRHRPLAGSAQVAPHLALVLMAEADGNRTRQRRGTPLSGFEDRRQLGRLCS